MITPTRCGRMDYGKIPEFVRAAEVLGFRATDVRITHNAMDVPRVVAEFIYIEESK